MSTGSLPVRTRPLCSLRLLIALLSAAGAVHAAGDVPADRSTSEPLLPLQAAIDEAVEHNLQVRIERHAVYAAEQDIEAAAAAFDPRIGLSGNVSQTERATVAAATQATQLDNRNYSAGINQRLPLGTELGLNTQLSRRDSDAGTDIVTLDYDSRIGASLRQPLLRGRGSVVNLAPLRLAESRYSESRLVFRERFLQILAATENAYWNVAYANARLRLRESSVTLAENLVEEARARVELGLGTELDVLQARSSLAARQEERIDARRELEDARESLLRQLGRLEAPLDSVEAATPYEVEGFYVVALPDAPPEVPRFSETWERALFRDPGTARQEELLRRREIDRRVARNNLRPSLDLVASGSFLGRDETAARNAYQQALEQDGHSWRLGIEVSMPWGQREAKARMRQADIRREQSELELMDHKSALYQDIRRTWRNLETSADREEAARFSRDLHERVYAQEEAKYAAGVSATRELLEAQRDWDEARLRHLNALLEQLRADIRLSQLDGMLLDRHGYRWDQDSQLID